MFRSGRTVAAAIEAAEADVDGTLSADAVQPNGVDLTVARVFEQKSPGRIGRDGKSVGDRVEVEPTREGGDVDDDGNDINDDAEGDDNGAGHGDDGHDDTDSPPTYTLQPGGYVVRYGEVLRVPEEHVGFVLPRSTLLRNSCTLNTAVWDAGYEGRGEGLLQVHHEIEIERGARIGQFVLSAAEHEGTYDGSYQGENIP